MVRSNVVATLKRAACYHAGELEAMRSDALMLGAHPEWPWKGLLISAATRGGSWRWAGKVEPLFDDGTLAWHTLENADNRPDAFLQVGRFKNRTADSLEKLYQFVSAEGGPVGVRARLSELDAAGVISFWCNHDGISDKYARNMMLDIYDQRFRTGFFAIDSRIDKLLPELGYAGPRHYAEKECFLGALAADASLDGWTLDRLLYNWNSDIRRKLELCNKLQEESLPAAATV